MSCKQYDLAFFIGRFHPVHYGHIANINFGINIADNFLLQIGSANAVKSKKNPFSYFMREEMIKMLYNDVFVLPLNDCPNDDSAWVKNIEDNISIVCNHCGLDKNSAKIALIGHHKDNSSYYLDLFPKYHLVEIDNFNNINATDIRESIFDENFSKIENLLPNTIYDYILELHKNNFFKI